MVEKKSDLEEAPEQTSVQEETENAADTEAPDAGTDVAQAAAADSLEDLQRQLHAAEAKAQENWEQYLRVRAEMENVRRRAQRDLESAHKYALDGITQELLPVVDSLELGLAAAEGEGATVEKLREGVELTLKMLLGVMEKFGIQPVDPHGERFNPEFHQAMTTQPADHVEPNTVLNVYQKGYLLNDRLVRPALVVVSSAADQAPGSKVDERA